MEYSTDSQTKAFRPDFQNEPVKCQREIVQKLVQLSTLAQVLGIADLNEENVGFVQSNPTTYSLCILGFEPYWINESTVFEDFTTLVAFSAAYRLTFNLTQHFAELLGVCCCVNRER